MALHFSVFIIFADEKPSCVQMEMPCSRFIIFVAMIFCASQLFLIKNHNRFLRRRNFIKLHRSLSKSPYRRRLSLIPKRRCYSAMKWSLSNSDQFRGANVAKKLTFGRPPCETFASVAKTSLFYRKPNIHSLYTYYFLCYYIHSLGYFLSDFIE